MTTFELGDFQLFDLLQFVIALSVLVQLPDVVIALGLVLVLQVVILLLQILVLVLTEDRRRLKLTGGADGGGARTDVYLQDLMLHLKRVESADGVLLFKHRNRDRRGPSLTGGVIHKHRQHGQIPSPCSVTAVLPICMTGNLKREKHLLRWYFSGRSLGCRGVFLTFFGLFVL